MTAYLGLGSNLGDRLANLQAAVNLLDLRAGTVTNISRVFESDPMYVENQPNFLNVAVELDTSLEPLALLRTAKEIEMEIGRMPGERFGPREIDIDLLAVVPDKRVETAELSLPHPRMHERRFVLEPLADLAPDLRISNEAVRDALMKPEIQKQTVRLFEHGVLSIHGD